MHIIRTSDRALFKQCRTKWDFGSKIRQNYEPAVTVKPLDFGTAIHEALAVYYNPDTWTDDRDVVEAEAINAFMVLCGKQKDQNLRVRDGNLAYEVEVDFSERRELGLGMLRYYFKWARANDHFTPILVEAEFEVPVLVPMNLRMPNNSDFTRLHDGSLWLGTEIVMYQGRIDMLVQDEYGFYWIFDHKTCAQMSSTEWLAHDDQITSYCWALSLKLGIPIKGFVYNELWKKVPHAPKELVRGGLSVNKQQDTTLALFMESIEKGNYNPESYADYINFLREYPKDFVRRTQVHRSPAELMKQSERICMEAMDMLSDPMIYPSPNKMNCNGCWFRMPCLATQDNSDVEFILTAQYKQRSNA